MIVLGIDPGAYGALATLNDSRLVNVDDMPILRIRRGKSDKAEVDGYALRAAARGVDVAYIELVGGMTGQSASAAFNFGRSCGIVEGSLKEAGVRVEFVPPGVWRKALGVNAGKDGSRALAARLWPAQSALFARKKDDGRAEAALVAEYGRRREMQNLAVAPDIFA